MKTLLSVDVEDWFQVDNLKQAINRDSWGARTSRVERNVKIILERLNEHNASATFFILGWIADRFPNLVREIHSQGHEIACHGYNHDLIYSLTQENFKSDVKRTKDILEGIIGERIIGYRAPNFSITDWAIDLLQSMEFQYDSSLYQTIAHKRYGKLKKYEIPTTNIFKLKEDFYQVMLSSIDLLGTQIPWAGGFYFRFIPYLIFKQGIDNILKKKGIYIFYIHPWEFDPEQPRIKNISLQHKFRHYTNLKKTGPKFVRMLKDFHFVPIRSILPKA